MASALVFTQGIQNAAELVGRVHLDQHIEFKRVGRFGKAAELCVW